MALVLFGSVPALAAEDKYHITPAEHLACDHDAIVHCSASQDEDDLLACMRTNRPSLSKVCLAAFDAGLKRRHLPL